MKLGKKFDEWSKKPRQGWLFRTSNFILYDTKAFNLVFIWGLWIAVIFTGFFALTFFLIKAEPFVTGLFCFFFVWNSWSLFKFYKVRKKIGDFDMTIHRFIGRNKEQIKVKKVK